MASNRRIAASNRDPGIDKYWEEQICDLYGPEHRIAHIPQRRVLGIGLNAGAAQPSPHLAAGKTLIVCCSF